jgi:hypothetical protein
LGDSRAVLGTRDENDQLVAIQLTVDLKPNIPSKPVFLSFVLVASVPLIILQMFSLSRVMF